MNYYYVREMTMIDRLCVIHCTSYKRIISAGENVTFQLQRRLKNKMHK